MKTKSLKRKPSSAGSRTYKPTKNQPATLKLQQILVPLDFSGKSRQALELAIPLAKQCGGKISLIYVVEPIYSYPSYAEGVGVSLADPNPQAALARKNLAELAGKLVPSRLLDKTLVRIGHAYVEIVKAADTLKADMIALTTHGHSGLEHVLLGSTAERVVRHANCPVLTVRQR